MADTLPDSLFSPTEGHAELPFRSDSPVYSDTWGVAVVDPDSDQAYWVQVLHNGSTGVARHKLMLISDGKASCDYSYTKPGDRFHTDLVDVELDGWKHYNIKSKTKNLELNAVSGHEPVDFDKLMTFKNFSLGHLEVGCRTTGHINGKSFTGLGLRDRSYGPRPMTGVGCVTTVVLVSEDLAASFSFNLVYSSLKPLAEDPSSTFGFASTPDGDQIITEREQLGVIRKFDGTAVGCRLGDHTLKITREIGHYQHTPHWYPSLDLNDGERRIYQHILRFVEGHHPVYGRMAGVVDQGILLPS
jgi:hypothetical protein